MLLGNNTFTAVAGILVKGVTNPFCYLGENGRMAAVAYGIMEGNKTPALLDPVS